MLYTFYISHDVVQNLPVLNFLLKLEAIRIANMERKQVSEDKHQSDNSCFIGIWKIMSYMKS